MIQFTEKSDNGQKQYFDDYFSHYQKQQQTLHEDNWNSSLTVNIIFCGVR